MIFVVAAIIRRGDHILITKRPEEVHLGGLWEFPGGKVEAGEEAVEALKREIREELGAEISVQDEYFRVTHHYKERSVEIRFFNCALVFGEPQPLDVAEMRWVLPMELHQYPFPEADRE